MKKLLLSSAAIAALTLGGAAVAQDAPLFDAPVGQADDAPAFKKGKKGKRGKRGGHHIKRMLKAADLSDAQKTEIKGIFEANKPAMKALKTQMKAARATGDPLQMQEAKLKMMEKRLEIMTDVRSRLSDAQWQKVIDAQAEHRAKRKARRGERRHKRGLN